MGTFLSVIPVVVRRVAANWRLLAAVVVGAVLASALMSTTSIYTDAIRDLGLTYALKTRGPDKINISIRTNAQSSEEDVYRKNQEFIESSTRHAIRPLLGSPITRLARSSTFYPTPPGGTVSEADSRPRSHLQFVTGLEPHVRIVEGRLPGDSAYVEGQAPNVGVAIGAETARRNNVKVGDRFDLHPFWRLDAEPIHATVTGIIDAVDPNQPFWLDEDALFTFPTSGWPTLPFFVSEATFFKAVAPYLPTMSSDYTSLVYLNTSPINARNANGVRDSLLGLGRQMESNLQRVSTTTELPAVLESFDEKLFFTRIPLLVLVLQVAGIVMYYLFMVSTMLVERQAGEIALLKSRGATTAQVMQIYVIEGSAILLIALSIGPPLAATVISFLGRTPFFSDLSGGANLSVHLSGVAYLWALAGAVLAYAMLLWPAYQATRTTVVQQRTSSARPPKQPAFTRYYLDLVLVGIGAILFYQLNRRGGLVTEKLFGDQTVDPIQLLTPAFFILTVGIVFLRLFPLALRLLAWLVARLQGTAVLIGMWQLVRNPVHYSRLVLLLMLATAVGMFAASFGATVNRSYEDRAAYESGAPLRLSAIRRTAASGPATMPNALAQEVGASAASPVLRTTASHGAQIDRTSLDVLGVDPKSFALVGYFRDDFADSSLRSLMDTLAKDEPSGAGVALPPGARWLGVWLNPVDLKGRVGLEVKARDATGRYFNYNLGPDAGAEFVPGWTFLVGDLSRPATGGGAASVQYAASPPQEPLTLVAISVRFLTRVSALTGTLQLDDLQSGPVVPGPLGSARMAYDPERRLPNLPDSKVIADFESASTWAPIGAMLPVPLNDETRAVPSGTGGSAIELQWRPVQGQPATHGLRPRGDERPLAVLASEAFLQKSGLKPGDKTTVFIGSVFLDIEIAGSFRLFPTLPDPRKEASFIANGARLDALINENPRGSPTVADEVWLKARPDAAARARQAQDAGRLTATPVSFDELRLAQQKDPLVAAGWEGILFISFAAILLLSAIGFLIYSYLTAQKRTLEFAVLRTMGFSRRQIAAVVGFEQAFVIGLGMLAGTAMGLRLGSLMIRYMGVTETGDEVLPPMLLHVSWFTIGSAWLALALVFLVTIGIVVLMYARLQLHRVLRIGEA